MHRVSGRAGIPEQGRRGGAESGTQLSILHGLRDARNPAGGPGRAADNPVARVLLDSPLPHLDRHFDYLVPAELDAAAQPGTRIRARFGAKEHAGFITGRLPESDSGARLIHLTRVVSPQAVLTPEILRLAESVAARYAGTVSDVLRVAVPPRVARVDKEFAPGASPAVSSLPEPPRQPAPVSWTRYVNGAGFIQHLAAGGSPHAVHSTLGGYGATAWPEEITDAVAAVWHSGRGAVVVVPDQRDLARLETALQSRLGAENLVRLTAEDGPTPRYRSFLKLINGQVRVAIGTRSAAYAPVRNLGLVCLWDDGDALHLEQRAPYQHVREVLLLRAEQQGCAALLSGVARSTESQRLVDTGWAQSVHADRSETRRSVARVLHSADAFHSARDPLAVQARIPSIAWKAAQDGLKLGPVLLQVARTGFSPALACQDCREQARCIACTGPLAQSGRGSIPACRWCGRPDPVWKCVHCGSARLRAAVVGAARTAEELGRAFPGVPVVSSAGDHVVDVVPDAPAVVVATPGAEPIAPGGYAAVILLDGTAMLARESLRAGEDTLRRWFGAAVLARPAEDGGLVVVTADDDAAAGHLVRWDPQGAAGRELAVRQELGLPPAVRYAALTGSREALTSFMGGLDAALFLRTAGPVPVPPAAGRPAPEEPGHFGREARLLLLFFSYRNAAAVVSALRARKAALSAKRASEPVRVRCDAMDLI